MIPVSHLFMLSVLIIAYYNRYKEMTQEKPQAFNNVITWVETFISENKDINA